METILVFILILCVSLGLSSALFLKLLPLRRTQSAYALILVDLAMVVWTAGYLLEILVPDVTGKLLWAKIQYLGIAFCPVFISLFLVQYFWRDIQIRSVHILAVILVPSLTILVAATNDLHGWLWTSVGLQQGELTLAPLALTHGWWFWVHVIYSYFLIMIATISLITITRKAKQPFLSQTLLMLVGMLVPWLANAIYIFQIRLEPGLDLTPIAFAITTGLMSLGFLRFGLLDFMPVAHATIFNAMVDGVIVLDMKDRIVDVNPAARRIFKSAGQLDIGNNIHPLLPHAPENFPAELVRDEVTIGLGKDQRSFLLQISPIMNSRGQITGRMALFTETSQLRKAESQMILQAQALNSAQNGIVITDPKGVIEWINPAFTHLTGYTFSEAVGQATRLLKSGKHTESFYKNLWDTLIAKKVWRGEMINRRKDGSLYDEEMTLTPILNEGGEITHIIGIKQDITQRKQAEEALRMANAKVLEASMLKTQLLANVSHDLRTPLSVIMGFAEMLNAGVYGSINVQQSKVLDDILDSSNQLLFFANNIIDRAQIDAGRIVLKKSSFRITELVDFAEISAGALAAKKGLRVDYEVDLNLPQHLYGDIYWLRQIVQNLMVNSVKFTDEGFVRFRLEKKNAAVWSILVTDTGIGIPEEAAERIFESFQQVDGSDTRTRGGSGLGLSIVKELVTLMDGTIQLESQMGVGSRFILNLPMIQDSEEK